MVLDGSDDPRGTHGEVLDGSVDHRGTRGEVLEGRGTHGGGPRWFERPSLWSGTGMGTLGEV